MNFYNIQEIRIKLQKTYNRGDIYKSYIQKSNIFPICVNFKKIQQKDIQNNFSLLLKKIQVLKDSNLPLKYKQFDFKSIGIQNLPVCVQIDSLNEYLDILNVQEYYSRFVENYEKVICKYPILKELILKKPMVILEYSDDWEYFFKIIDFFISNSNPRIYIREISLANIDTKYIEKHIKILDILLSNIIGTDVLKSISDWAFEKKYNLKYQLPQVRFRILDDDLAICGLKDLTLPIDEFESLIVECKKVFIVENKITFLSFPKNKNSIVIFGSGYNVGVLKNTKWLKDKEIFYWGDIDIDGFAILSQVRGYFSQVQSILMDEDTINKYRYLSAVDTKRKFYKEKPENLTKKEAVIFDNILFDFYSENFRLEQERLPLKLIKY